MLAYPLATIIALQTLATLPLAGPQYVKRCDPCTIVLHDGNPPANFRFELETVPEGRVVKAIIFERGGHAVQKLDVPSMTPSSKMSPSFLGRRKLTLTAGSTCCL